MTREESVLLGGLAELRRALAVLGLRAPSPTTGGYGGTSGSSALPAARLDAWPGVPSAWLLTESGTPTSTVHGASAGLIGPQAGPPSGDHQGRDPGAGEKSEAIRTASSSEDPDVAAHLIAMVEQARTGDPQSFGALFDHYHPRIYRFVYYRTGSVQLAEDLSSEVFVRALRNIAGFTWQGKDFGAWLTTIARNLITDHFKSARSRLEHTTEDQWLLDAHLESPSGPEDQVLADLTNEALLEAVRTLPEEQQTCVVMRFLQGMSIAEVAVSLERSEGAVKQLQLRAVRNLAKRLPEGT